VIDALEQDIRKIKVSQKDCDEIEEGNDALRARVDTFEKHEVILVGQVGELQDQKDALQGELDRLATKTASPSEIGWWARIRASFERE